jgi:thiol-disulfide isomerase/thioredoxin
MGGKTAIALGLLLGVVAGAGLLSAALLLAPAPGVPVPTRPPLATLPPPTPSPVGSAVPSQPAGASPSAGASGDPAGGATPTALFGVGGPAPALVVPGLDGGTVDLASYRGKPVWINFMATWCPPCRDELPVMAGFQARYANDGLKVLLVDEREDASTVRSFLSGLDVSLPAALDGDGSALTDWGALALPVHFWIDANGVIQDAALGGIGPDVMARGLTRILPGVTVTP